MCGIVGYVGREQAVPILLQGLKRLEYRGYDSSGLAVLTPQSGRVILRKAQGKIHNLEELINSQPPPSNYAGIAHTRWATHGAPNRVNAHPHADCRGKILVVHNGIIENYQTLKDNLREKGHKFVSETDTEIIAHLIEEYDKGDFLKAVLKAILQLKGAFALGVISTDHPETLIAARAGSPLIVGLGKGENFIASDVPAIAEHTQKIIFLKDKELVVLKKDQVNVYKFSGEKIPLRAAKVDIKAAAVEKQGYAHFMLKEIHEQKDVLKQMFQYRVQGKNVCLDGLDLSDKQLRELKNIVVVACGTAYHAGLIGKYIIEAFARIPVSVDVSSEFRYRGPILNQKSLVVAISQSGETADTLAAVREAKSKGARIVSICNVVGSSLTRESDGVLYTHAGPEIGVASTKAYTAQLSMLYLLAVKLGLLRGGLSRKEGQALIKNLKEVPRLYSRILQDIKSIESIAYTNAHFGCFLFLGRNINYPSALEGALKLKEISYVPAEGYPAGEMKHGPIALIDEYRAVVCITPESETYEKMISNIQEIKARKGKIIAIATEGDAAIKQHTPQVMYIPQTHKLLTPLLAALPLQLFAYYIAVKRGCDVDQPRNLAKSVTVE